MKFSHDNPEDRKTVAILLWCLLEAVAKGTEIPVPAFPNDFNLFLDEKFPDFGQFLVAEKEALQFAMNDPQRIGN